MVFVPTLDTAEVDVRYVQDGQKIENTLWFHNTGGTWTSALLEALATAVGQWAIDEILAQASTGVNLNEVYARDQSIASGAEYTWTPATTESGANATVALPMNVSPCISFRTAKSGRSYRGRNFIVGTCASTQSGTNEFSNTAAGLWKAAYEALMPDYVTPVMGADISHVVVSKFLNGAARGAGVWEPIIAYLFTNRDFDSQRRRLPGRGR